MIEVQRLVIYSGGVGFFCGLIAFVYFAIAIGSERFRSALGIPIEYGFVFPVGGGILAACVCTRFDPKKFGALRGLAVAVISFVLFCAIYSVSLAALAGGSNANPMEVMQTAFWLFLSFVFFGTLMIGWFVFPVGALFGAAYKRHSNKPFNTDALKRAG
jgi:hypothetical protein